MSAPDLTPREAALLSRLIDDPVSAERDPEVLAFLEAHPEHADLLDCLRETGPALTALGAQESARMLPRLQAQAQESLASGPRWTDGLMRPRVLAVAACLLLVALIGAAVLQNLAQPTGRLAFATGPVEMGGEQIAPTERSEVPRGTRLSAGDAVAIFELGRGAGMALNRNSTVEIDHLGRMTLSRGEVLVAAHDRAVTVRVEGGKITGHGTIFCVRQHTGGTPEVDVTLGEAQLTYRGDRLALGPGLGGDLPACFLGHAKPLESDDHLPEWLTQTLEQASDAGVDLRALFAPTP